MGRLHCASRLHPSCCGGGSGIRTHDTVACITVFKTAAIVHSAIPPRLLRSPVVELSSFRS